MFNLINRLLELGLASFHVPVIPRAAANSYGWRKTLYTYHKNVGRGRVYRNKGVQEAARRKARMLEIKEAA